MLGAGAQNGAGPFSFLWIHRVGQVEAFAGVGRAVVIDETQTRAITIIAGGKNEGYTFFLMDELEKAGKSGYHIKIKPELRVAARRFKVDVSKVARSAIVAAVREAAGRELMAKRGAQG